MPGILRHGEMHVIAGLIAPRHFPAVAGRDAPIFPVAHTRPPTSPAVSQLHLYQRRRAGAPSDTSAERFARRAHPPALGVVSELPWSAAFT